MEGTEIWRHGVWKLNILMSHNVPGATHQYFLPVLAPDAVSAKAEILARSIKFFQVLRAAPSQEVVTASLMLARDMRTTLAKNLAYVERLTGQDTWAAGPNLIRTIVSQKEIMEPSDVIYLEAAVPHQAAGSATAADPLGEKERVQELIFLVQYVFL